ncbi:hypothetical protein OS189_12985 [Sulfitobacter sp. F26169L]|uniref:hypothetical protein n=1 Tax=Sulfitobacter sp. F26169L TaxID=2996015 RepID=UPI002260FB01|nr:hypothetical protein [Sulfitobacter sp. F26169L]MCX7567260.1 hypothetical protein [Sulfitobacter sp. F26169L]
MKIEEFGLKGDIDKIDVDGLTDNFADPEALMAAASHDDVEATLMFDLDGETSTPTAMSENEAGEEDYRF